MGHTSCNRTVRNDTAVHTARLVVEQIDPRVLTLVELPQPLLQHQIVSDLLCFWIRQAFEDLVIDLRLAVGSELGRLPPTDIHEAIRDVCPRTGVEDQGFVLGDRNTLVTVGSGGVLVDDGLLRDRYLLNYFPRIEQVL